MVKFDPEKESGSSLDKWLREVKNDPLRFVQEAFPWGKEGTELYGHTGPDTWQTEFLTAIRDELLTVNAAIRAATASGHGVGKAQPVDLVIDTPRGPRRFGEINVGDYVFGVDGKPTRVIAVHERGILPIYRVTFDDRTSTLCCGDHLWNVRGRKYRRRGIASWETISTSEIVKRGLRRSNGIAGARTWEIPRQAPVEYSPRWVPIDPYTLGCWLGDGTRKQSHITSADDEVARKIAGAGYHVSWKQKHKNRAATIRVSPNIGPFLSRLGLYDCYSYQKFVPESYKFNTADVRAEILRGLIDTDGFISKDGGIIFCSSSERLTDDFIWLVRSLGGKAIKHRNAKKTGYRRKDGTMVECLHAYHCGARLPDGFLCGYVRRKIERIKPKSESRYMARWMESIEPAGETLCRCITVADKSGLYLTNDFIVTHNSTLVSWLILWAMSTMPDTRGIITANTEVQLRTKTWPELARWWRMCKTREMFTYTATALFSSDEDHEKTWRVDAITWSETRTEAFAGLHNHGKRILCIFDEASAIPDVIWETTEGAMTDKDTQIIWAVFGNPTRNTGRFKECFGRLRHRWKTHQVDSRTSRFTNKDEIKEWVTDYGEDSDFVRVRVRGVFPRAGTMQFIPTELAEQAASHERQQNLEVTILDPLVIGVDIARFGTNATVIAFRRGRDAVSIPWVVMRGADTVQVAGRVAALINEYKPDAVFIDDGGVGGGVVDQLRHLGHVIFAVTFGAAADYFEPTAEGKVAYANKRVEMYGSLKSWLKYGAIPATRELLADLTGVEYGYTIREGRDALILEKKEDMMKRGLDSPDFSDALACTFAQPVAHSDHRAQLTGKPVHKIDYDPMAEAYNAR